MITIAGIEATLPSLPHSQSFPSPIPQSSASPISRSLTFPFIRSNGFASSVSRSAIDSEANSEHFINSCNSVKVTSLRDGLIDGPKDEGSSSVQFDRDLLTAGAETTLSLSSTRRPQSTATSSTHECITLPGSVADIPSNYDSRYRFNSFSGSAFTSPIVVCTSSWVDCKIPTSSSALPFALSSTSTSVIPSSTSLCSSGFCSRVIPRTYNLNSEAITSSFCSPINKTPVKTLCPSFKANSEGNLLSSDNSHGTKINPELQALNAVTDAQVACISLSKSSSVLINTLLRIPKILLIPPTPFKLLTKQGDNSSASCKKAASSHLDLHGDIERWERQMEEPLISSSQGLQQVIPESYLESGPGCAEGCASHDTVSLVNPPTDLPIVSPSLSVKPHLYQLHSTASTQSTIAEDLPDLPNELLSVGSKPLESSAYSDVSLSAESLTTDVSSQQHVDTCPPYEVVLDVRHIPIDVQSKLHRGILVSDAFKVSPRLPPLTSAVHESLILDKEEISTRRHLSYQRKPPKKHRPKKRSFPRCCRRRFLPSC